MIDRSHALPVVRQAELAGLRRASVYYLPRATSDADQRLMKRIDAIHLEYPFAGARMLRDLLLREGFNVGRRHIGTLMARMGIEALYRKLLEEPLHRALAPKMIRHLLAAEAEVISTAVAKRAIRDCAAAQQLLQAAGLCIVLRRAPATPRFGSRA